MCLLMYTRSTHIIKIIYLLTNLLIYTYYLPLHKKVNVDLLSPRLFHLHKWSLEHDVVTSSLKVACIIVMFVCLAFNY